MAVSFAQVARFLPGPDTGAQLVVMRVELRPIAVNRTHVPQFADFRVHFGLGELELFSLVVTFGARFWTFGRRGWEPVKVREVDAVPLIPIADAHGFLGAEIDPAGAAALGQKLVAVDGTKERGGAGV